MEYHRTMFDLHKQVNPKEVIVGWYAPCCSDFMPFLLAVVFHFHHELCANSEGPKLLFIQNI